MKTGAKQTRESQENVKDSKKDIDKYRAEQLPSKGNKLQLVSDGVTFSEEKPNSLTVIPEVSNNRSSSRQIQPSLHTAPADPPTADSDDLTIRLHEENATDVEVYVPVLPSVKKLANKFQVNKVDDLNPVIVNKKVENIYQTE